MYYRLNRMAARFSPRHNIQCIAVSSMYPYTRGAYTYPHRTHHKSTRECVGIIFLAHKSSPSNSIFILHSLYISSLHVLNPIPKKAIKTFGYHFLARDLAARVRASSSSDRTRAHAHDHQRRERESGRASRTRNACNGWCATHDFMKRRNGAVARD